MKNEEQLRLEFESLINDDELFKEQWAYNDEGDYYEIDFKEWLNTYGGNY